MLLASMNPIRTLFRAPLVEIGEFRCSPSHPDFRRAGAITQHCFVFPRRAVWIQHDGGAPFLADSTRITFYNPGQPYQRRALDPAGDASDWITVSEDLAREVVGRIDPRAADAEAGAFRWAYGGSVPAVYLERRLLHQHVRQAEAADPLLIEERAIHLFAGVMSALYASRGVEPARPGRRNHRELAEAACAHLNRTFARHEGLTPIAQSVGTSVFHLCRVFRRETGLSIHAYRTQLRLRHALEAMDRRDADLLALALGVGYSGHSHFTAAFRKHFGLSPSQVRERCSGDHDVHRRAHRENDGA
jgi:AraC-like DNA-binding protein